MVIRKVCEILVLLMLTACYREENSHNKVTKGENMDTQIVEVEMESELSGKTLIWKLPRCFLDNRLKGDISARQKSSSLHLDYPRLAFSDDIEETEGYQCPKGGDSRLVKIWSINPVDKKNFRGTDSYFLDSEKQRGAFFLEQKNGMQLYKTGVDSTGIFFEKGYDNLKYPMFIDFLAYDPKTPNSPFRYFFSIYTIIHDEYIVSYKVVAIESNQAQFAEKFRQVIEQNKPVLDFPEIINKFVHNNEKVASYFEAHSAFEH